FHDKNSFDSLSGNVIRALASDKDGGLWIGTRQNGLNYLPPNSTRFRHFKTNDNDTNQIASNMVQSLLLHSSGQLWVGTWEQGISILNLSTGNWTQLGKDVSANQDRGLQDNAVVSLIESQQGDIWAGTVNGGLQKISKDTKQIFAYQHSPQVPYSIADSAIYSLMQDKLGNIWSATWGGGVSIVNADASQFTRYRSGESFNLASGSVEGIVRDAEGTLWIGSEGGGLNYLLATDTDFQQLHYSEQTPNGLNDNDVEVVYQDPVNPDWLWLGTRFGGLNRLDKKSLDKESPEFVHYKKGNNPSASISGNDVRAILRDKKDLWVGTTTGLTRLNLESGEARHFLNDPNDSTSISNNSVYALFMDSDNRLWVGTNGGGLNRFERSNNQFIAYKSDPQIKNSLSHNTVWDIVEDSEKNLWVTTSRGLNKLHYTQHDSLQPKFDTYGDQKFVSLLLDDNGNFWLSGLKGIYCFSPKTEQFKLFNEKDGSLSRHTYPAKFKDYNGQFYFGGYDGLTQFDPLNIGQQDSELRVRFTRLSLYDRAVTGAESSEIINQRLEDAAKISIPYTESAFTIHFSALAHAVQQKVTYQYRLIGFDRRWTTTSINRVTYTNLDPGLYRLEITAKLADGKWDTPVSHIAIEVLAPFWKNPWAIVLYSAILVLIIRFYLNLQRQKIALQTLEKLSSSDQLTGLKNRYFVEQHMPQDVSLALSYYRKFNNQAEQRAQEKFDLILYIIDIDHFKQVNDQHGHRAGDMVLIQMSKILNQVFRQSDYLVRWGGEEFLVVARSSRRKHAARLAERLRKKVESNKFILAKDLNLSVTCSIGFVVFPLSVQSPGSLSWSKSLELADYCLYAAKKTSRNAWVGITEIECSQETLGSVRNLKQNFKQLVESGDIKLRTSIEDKASILWD
ncbi:MAG: diguanylate cyclase, partial [Kangiellaceae bacterium]|nr:diguanylate cyclase [Kangiellaceae bacterium]